MKLRQGGFFLIEAMVAVLIFAFGILGMVALAGKAVGAQGDSRYRTVAAALADEIASEIALRVDRTNEATIQSTVINFQHHPTGAPAGCNFTGSASTDAKVLAWAAKAHTVGPGLPGLPGAGANSQQIVV